MLKLPPLVSLSTLLLTTFVATKVKANSLESACDNRTATIDLGSSSSDSSSSRAQVFSDLSLYMLNGLSPDKSCSMTRSLEIHCKHLVAEACTLLAMNVTVIDYEDLRDFYQDNHIATIQVRRHDDYIKSTLVAFIEATNYQHWPNQVIKRSGIKQKTRVIYRSPSNFPQQMSVSETRDCDNGDLRAPKLETEIAIRRHGNEGSFEFYTYDKSGNLSVASEFPAGERPSPTICVSCHYHPGQRSVSRFLH